MKTPLENWEHLFQELTPVQRVAAVIDTAMMLRGQTSASIAKRHRLSRWYVAAVARGKRNMTPALQRMFEADLHIDLTPFLAQVRGGGRE